MRVVICYNKRSSRFREISREVLEPLKKMTFEVYEFEVKKASVSENARRLSKILRQGDVVISAGGDGTAISLAVMAS